MGYDYKLDLSNGNSTHTRILNLVGRGKKVLEVGCATGYMTRYLREELDCRVSCIEIDPDAAEKAGAFSEKIVIGDIEELDCTQTLGMNRFDVIILADVLEHLKDPGRVLMRLRNYLAPEGFLLISVPNGAHGSLALEVLDGRWKYREEGLLDRSHLHFFDRDTMSALLDATGFHISRLERIIVHPRDTEMKTAWESYPREVTAYLERVNPEFQTYQFVMKAYPTTAQGWKAGLEDALEAERKKGNRLETELKAAQLELAKCEQGCERLDEITSSSSWRLTRPFRVARRLMTRKRLWTLANPLRWPRVLRLLVHYLRLEGLRGTLEVLQAQPFPNQPAAVTPVPTPSPETVADPVCFQAARDPEVSVIIPIRDQLHFTSNCLASLAAARTRVSFEVIVIDDGSSDGSLHWLKRCEGVRAVRNHRNLGFIRACNRGASLASGRWLVLLNNDTQVTDGWLDALIRTFETQRDVGIVGGRLVFGDGSLQEAGGIVFRDGTAWNFGRGENPARPEFNIVSEADYVSGACLAIERELYSDLGGLDIHYAPAYYEDTDLCFKVRDRGLKVYCQPAATIFHFEGGTSGTDEDAGAKRHQVINRERFAERWAGTLEAYPEKPETYSLEQAIRLRYRRFPRNALVIDAVTPMPDQDSGSMRMFALLRLLRDAGFRTRFMPQNLSWSGRYSSNLQQAGIEVLAAPWVKDPAAWLRKNGADLELIIVSHHHIMRPLLRALRKYCPAAQLVFDTVDLHFLREQREAELADSASAVRAAERTRTKELAMVRAADATLVVSDFERDLLAELTPNANIAVVSNIHSLQDPGQPFDQRRDLVFVGGFQHPPNVDGALWLLDDIFPLIRIELPDVRLHLIGSKMPDELSGRSDPGVIAHGFVADLEPYMTGCRVSVAPLRYGAGVKGKVNQAMSYGLPVVATSCATEGMRTEHEVDILVADDARAFAAEVIRVYQDRQLWEKLAVNARVNVQRHFSVDAARRAVEDLIQSLNLN